MARLQIKTSGLDNPSIELRLGRNQIGRRSDSDFQISHPSVSGLHCELILTNGQVLLRDLGSTNGTFVNGQRIQEVALIEGQTVRLGDVELLVENTDVTVAIPKFWNTAIAVTPATVAPKSGGAECCPRHEDRPVTHRCSVCKDVMCDACVHRIRRKGGKVTLLLCPTCSNVVEFVGNAPKKKNSLLSTLRKLGQSTKHTITRALRPPTDEA